MGHGRGKFVSKKSKDKYSVVVKFKQTDCEDWDYSLVGNQKARCNFKGSYVAKHKKSGQISKGILKGHYYKVAIESDPYDIDLQGISFGGKQTEPCKGRLKYRSGDFYGAYWIPSLSIIVIDCHGKDVLRGYLERQ